MPYAPAQPTIKSASATFIEPEWTAPFNGGSDIRGYKVYKDNVHLPIFTTPHDQLFLKITDSIAPGVNYEVVVVAFNDVGSGIGSDPRVIMAAAVPDPPSGLTLISQSPSEITFSWSAPYDGGT